MHYRNSTPTEISRLRTKNKQNACNGSLLHKSWAIKEMLTNDIVFYLETRPPSNFKAAVD